MTVALERTGVAVFDEGLELLEEAECLALMSQVHVGRVGVSIGALPAIFPVNFVLSDGAVYFRTGEGTKLDAATTNAVVAFETDRFDAFEHGGWSVLAVGTAAPVTNPAQLAALSHLRLQPWAGGRRDHLVRVPIEFVSGRRISHDELGGPNTAT